ncbi:PIN domain nuclease [Aquiflexum sp.]|uniref:type II toxin-antitoxin system VapC family toxin n=1 Tax=Aquiflexum sp. TaxID=1872584 RepID=UPI003593DADC
MILADSSVWIDFFNGMDKPHVEKLYELLGKEIIATGDLIVVEVLQGFQSDSHFETAKEVFERLAYFSLCNKNLAVATANNYRILRKEGITIRKTIDMVIGTFCIENDITLLHHDKDFIPMEEILNLKVIKY